MAPCRNALKHLRRHLTSSANRQGFTLIEVLVSGMVLAFIVTLSFFALSIYMNEWEQQRLSNIDAIEMYRKRELIQRAIISIWEYYVTDPQSEQNNIFYPYFKGTEQTMSFITTSPVFAKSRTAAARIRIAEAAEHGSSILIYEEAPLDRFYLRYYEDDIDYPFTLRMDLAASVALKFRYYGLSELRWAPDGERVEEVFAWHHAFDAKDRHALPEQIALVPLNGDEEPVLAFTVMARNRAKAIFYDSF